MVIPVMIVRNILRLLFDRAIGNHAQLPDNGAALFGIKAECNKAPHSFGAVRVYDHLEAAYRQKTLVSNAFHIRHYAINTKGLHAAVQSSVRHIANGRRRGGHGTQHGAGLQDTC